MRRFFPPKIFAAAAAAKSAAADRPPVFSPIFFPAAAATLKSAAADRPPVFSRGREGLKGRAAIPLPPNGADRQGAWGGSPPRKLLITALLIKCRMPI